MRKHSLILRFAAFLLILVFSQKAGAGLLLHNLLHKTTTDSKIPGQENGKSNELSFNCNCIDDFLIPFAEAEEPVCSELVLSHVVPFIFFDDYIPFHTTVFSPLRGPPARLV